MAAERHVLVAGGAGYIGSVLVPILIASGYRVTALDSLLYENSDSLGAVADSERFAFVHGDMRSAADVSEAVSGATDVVLLAALVGDPVCKQNPELARGTNLDGARNLLAAASDAGIQRFIFASTCSNYGLREDDSLATEEDELPSSVAVRGDEGRDGA